MPLIRRDVQFLRGVAVLAVVLYHANFAGFSNGFLGVDVFFVISGFLITSIILRSLEDERFSFASFYVRRARRLLPALYCTLAFTTLLAYLFLTQRQWGDYRAQLFGSISFTSNMVLPFQVGYFEDAAESKPLLHIWSLSLEEQFYLLMPLLLWSVAARWRGLQILVLGVASFALCQLLLAGKASLPGLDGVAEPVQAFYSLPARAWELLAGSGAAWLMLRKPKFAFPSWIKRLVAVLLMASLGVSLDAIHPRGDALLVVFLTLVLLLGKDDWLPGWWPVRCIERVGDISYSLYLIHWPLLAFSYVAYLGNTTQGQKLLAVAVSVALAFAQYHWVEQKFREVSAKRTGRNVLPLVVATVILILSVMPSPGLFSANESAGNADYAQLRRPNTGLSYRCAQGAEFRVRPECAQTENPGTAVWGDSYAMHLVPGLRENTQTAGTLVQLTKSNCNPAVDLAAIVDGMSAARECVAFNRWALDYMLQTPSISRVVIGSPFGYFYSGFQRLYLGETVDADFELTVASLAAAIDELQQAGKQVVVVSPTPSADFDLGECLERKASGALVLGRDHCDISFPLYLARQGAVLTGLKRVQSQTGVPILWLSDLLCNEEVCQTRANGIDLYRDKGHLSVGGSKLLLGQISIFPQG